MKEADHGEVNSRFCEFLEELESASKVRIMRLDERGAIEQFRQNLHDLEELLHLKQKACL